MTQKSITLALIVNSKSNDELLRCIESIDGQDDNDFNVCIIDRLKRTHFDDVTYYPNENHAIDQCGTDYIYFMSSSTMLDFSFVRKMKLEFERHPAQMYWFNLNTKGYLNDFWFHQDTIYELHGTIDKVFSVEFLKKNYIGFDLSKYKYDINHVMLCYCILSNANLTEIYAMRDNLVTYRAISMKGKEYRARYIQMINELKMMYYDKCLRNQQDVMSHSMRFLNKSLIIEDTKIMFSRSIM